jgi:hypothetical protein
MVLADQFTASLRSACSKSRSLGYYPHDFEQMLDRWGGVQTAKRLVTSGDLQTGLKRLHAMGRLDLSMEKIMLDADFRSLFTEQELEAADWRLKQLTGHSRV